MEQHESIIKYVQGNLTREEKMAFEKKLASDSQLAEALAEFQKSQLAIKAAARQQLRERAGSAYRTKTTANKRVLLMQRLAIAASFLLLLAAGLWYFTGGQPDISSDQLFAQYFEMPAAPALRSGNNQTINKWQQAIFFYGENDFNAAIPIFNELILEDNFTEKETAKLLLGASLLSINKPDDALIIFNNINTDSSFKEDAEWYSALALLKVGKKEAAKSVLENIVQQKQHFKKEEAFQILEQW